MADEPNEPTDEMVEALAAKLREGTGQDTTWWGDCLDVARSGLSAALEVDPKRQGSEADLSVADLSVEAEIEVTDEMIEAFRLAFCALKGKRRIIEDVLSVSPLREQVQKLTEENERLRKALHRIAHPGRLFQDSAVKMSTAARAALSPSYKGEQ